MNFHHPEFLLLYLLPILFLVARRRRAVAAIMYPRAEELRRLPVSAVARTAAVIPWLQLAAVFLAITALAGPHLVHTRTAVTSLGVDIAIAIDLSTSMLAVDASAPAGQNDRRTTRLALAKGVLRDFIARRGADRISVVAFGARAYPVAPLTLDHHWLVSTMEALETSVVEDGTALGDGILAAVNRLRSSPAGSRTAIVLTDGRSNTGLVTPAAAASAAAALGIKVHAIGIGGRGVARFPVENPLGGVTWREVEADLDEPALREVADLTGGTYFHADGAQSLRAVFAEIDRLEKRKFEEKRSSATKELFPYFVGGALLSMMSAQLLLCNRFRRLP